MWELESCDNMIMMIDEDEQLKITVTKTIMKTSKQFTWTALFKG